MNSVLPQEPAPGGHRGVTRIAEILRLAAAAPAGVRLTDVATKLAAPRSSVHNLLKGLTAVEFLELRNNRYVIGPGVQRLLTPFRATSIIEIARDEIETLRDRFNETTLLGTVIDESVVYLSQAESTELIRYTAPLREPRPLYPTSIGKQFLASLEDEEVAELKSAIGIKDLSAAARDFNVIRATGLAFNHEETVKGTTAVSAAIKSVDGEFIAAISMVGPVYRMDTNLVDRIAPALLDAASRISDRLTMHEMIS